MTSLRTSTAAAIALQTLRATDRNLDATAQRIATGLRVASASDGAAYWAIATTLRSENATLGALHDSIGLQRGALDVTARRVDRVIDQLGVMSRILVSAASVQVDRAKLQDGIATAQDAIRSVVEGASTLGANWLSVDSQATGFDTKKEMVISLPRAGQAGPPGAICLDTSGLILFDARPREGGGSAFSTVPATGTLGGILGDIAAAASRPQPEGYRIQTWDGESWRGGQSIYLTWNYGLMDTQYYVADGPQAKRPFSIATIDLTAPEADEKMIQAFARVIDATREKLVMAAATLGATATLLSSQQTFIHRMIDMNTAAIGTLVDADLEEEAAKLKALQVQRDLGLQALGIANAAPEAVLALFRS